MLFTFSESDKDLSISCPILKKTHPLISISFLVAAATYHNIVPRKEETITLTMAKTRER